MSPAYDPFLFFARLLGFVGGALGFFGLFLLVAHVGLMLWATRRRPPITPSPPPPPRRRRATKTFRPPEIFTPDV